MAVEPSFSHPRVSDDNPFSEALFRTLKYRPCFPDGPFASIEAASAGEGPEGGGGGTARRKGGQRQSFTGSFAERAPKGAAALDPQIGVDGAAPRDQTPYGQKVTDNRLERICERLVATSDYARRQEEIARFNAEAGRGKYLGPKVALAFGQDVASGVFRVEGYGVDDMKRALALQRRHLALRIGLVDSIVMAVAERHRASAIVTLDERHFRAVPLKPQPRLIPFDS